MAATEVKTAPAQVANAATATADADAAAPAKAGIVLATLIIIAAVANLPLAMANVALPSIGAYFDASQTQLNLVAVAYSLGLACSVLWLGALGDRYGRKQIAILGVALAMPAALICGFAPTIEVLIAGRLFGGFAAGMAYPTTLALIAALWGPGPGTHAFDRAVGGARRRHQRLRAAALRACCWSASPGTRSSSSCCRWRWWRCSWRSSSCPRTSTRKPRSRSTTSAASSRWCWSARSSWPSTLRRWRACARW